MMSEEDAMVGRANEPHPYLKVTEDGTWCFWCGESEENPVHQNLITEVPPKEFGRGLSDGH